MLPPDGALVERSEPGPPRLHVAEAAEPDERVRVVQVPELPEHVHADGLLARDELALEQLDQRLPSTRVQRVSPQLDDRAGHSSSRRDRVITQFVSQVTPASGENACSQRADVGVMSVQSKRTRTGRSS